MKTYSNDELKSILIEDGCFDFVKSGIISDSLFRSVVRDSGYLWIDEMQHWVDEGMYALYSRDGL